MKVVILCGGKGTRLREETEYKPKPLVTIGDKPILWHIMKIYSHYGFNDFILCLGYKGEMIKDYFLKYREINNDFTLDFCSKNPKVTLHNNSPFDNWKITFVDTGLETMTGGRIARIKKYIGDQDFFLTYGDGLADIDIKDLYRFHKRQKKVATITGIYPRTFYGCLSVRGDLAKGYTEKPVFKKWVNGGFYVCNKKIFNYLSEDESCIFEKKPLSKIAKDNQLAVYRHTGAWHTMNTSKDHEDLNTIWRLNKPKWRIWE